MKWIVSPAVSYAVLASVSYCDSIIRAELVEERSPGGSSVAFPLGRTAGFHAGSPPHKPCSRIRIGMLPAGVSSLPATRGLTIPPVAGTGLRSMESAVPFQASNA
jgi:hypothetical protein